MLNTWKWYIKLASMTTTNTAIKHGEKPLHVLVSLIQYCTLRKCDTNIKIFNSFTYFNCYNWYLRCVKWLETEREHNLHTTNILLIKSNYVSYNVKCIVYTVM